MLIKGLYSIVNFEKEENRLIRATIKLNPDHEVFEGHFPGNPILPGVCTLQIIKELTEKALNKNLFLKVTSNVKFMAIINPQKNDLLNLVLNLSETEDGIIKVKNTTSFEDTLALKLNATFKVL